MTIKHHARRGRWSELDRLTVDDLVNNSLAYRWVTLNAIMKFGINQDSCATAGGAGRPAPLGSRAGPRIIVFTRSYPPAYLRGGPARSVHALVEALSPEFSFTVITSACDNSTARVMETVDPDRWSRFGRARVWYASQPGLSVTRSAGLIRAAKPKLVYLNSLFDCRFGLLPLLTTRLMSRRVPVVLAPRGELSAGALALKRRKKSLFISLFRLLRLHLAVTWHASTSQERADIERVFGPGVTSHVATDLRTGLSVRAAGAAPRDGADGSRRGSVVFFSRIVPKKNVESLIRALPMLRHQVSLSIAGPIEDERYWTRCLKVIDAIPNPAVIKYEGAIPGADAVDFLGGFDLFVLPTLGENFGHVVLESLAAGTPVIVGKDTPWACLKAAGAGWTCDPTNLTEIAELIDQFFSLSDVARQGMRVAALNLAGKILGDQSAVHDNRLMFKNLLSVNSGSK